jgi:hypothetical protein
MTNDPLRLTRAWNEGRVKNGFVYEWIRFPRQAGSEQDQNPLDGAGFVESIRSPEDNRDVET